MHLRGEASLSAGKDLSRVRYKLSQQAGVPEVKGFKQLLIDIFAFHRCASGRLRGRVCFRIKATSRCQIIGFVRLTRIIDPGLRYSSELQVNVTSACMRTAGDIYSTRPSMARRVGQDCIISLLRPLTDDRALTARFGSPSGGGGRSGQYWRGDEAVDMLPH